MYKIYVAGAISDPDVLQVLENLKIGQRVSVELLLKGYAPYCPFIDYQFFFQLRDGETITGEQIKAYSMEWLGACDAVFVLPNSENSKGTQAEIKRAITLEIPVFTSIATMDEYFKSPELTKLSFVYWQTMSDIYSRLHDTFPIAKEDFYER
jgi:hypothetical protein